mgnify:CR=1 FL=1
MNRNYSSCYFFKRKPDYKKKLMGLGKPGEFLAGGCVSRFSLGKKLSTISGDNLVGDRVGSRVSPDKTRAGTDLIKKQTAQFDS